MYWIQLTNKNGVAVWVNMDKIASMEPAESGSFLYPDSLLPMEKGFSVQETPQQIAEMLPAR